MTPERRHEIDELYRAVLECPASERARLLSERTEGDTDLRIAVESLLARQPATAMGVPHAAPATLIGEQVQHYRIEQQLGAGGMGIVYRATDTRLNRPVALKFLADDVVDAASRHRFQREAQTASSLNHPHILTVHDIGEHRGRQYIVTEFMDGGTLVDWLRQRPRSWREIVELLAGVADALAVAHEASILHRDIKPGNILVNRSGYAKLADFGLAKLAREGDASRSGLEHATAAGFVVGTLAYMAPEQVLGGLVDARCDVFAFGVVLYEALAGQRPFNAESDVGLAEVILRAPPLELRDSVPESLRAVVAKALQKEPAARHSTMRDLLAALRQVSRGSDDVSGRNAAAPGAQSASNSGPHRSRKGIASLAVLPLVNTTGDPDWEYLSEGIAESLINSFSQLPKLRVAQQQKSFRYKGAGIDIQRAATELGVQAVLTGRLAVRGDTLVVSIGLVDVQGDAQVWGQQYTKKIADIFVLQDQIAGEVLAALKLKLVKQSKKQRRTQSTAAYHLYLKGRFFWGKRSSDNIRKALTLYQQALDEDPGYALAYAGIADCYALLGFTSFAAMPPSEAFPRAKAAALKALAFDDSLAEAHASLGACALLYDWDWMASERAFRQALEIAPDNVGARVWHSTLLAVMGRHDDAVREARRATQSDPLSVIAAAHVSLRLYNAGRHDEAVSAAQKAIELDPTYPTAHAYLAFAHEANGSLEQAIESAEATVSIMRSPHWRAYLASLYGLAARRSDAARVLDEIRALAVSEYVSPYSLALVYSGLGDVEQWQRYAEASLAERSGLLIYLKCGQWFGAMRARPFYGELVRGVGLP